MNVELLQKAIRSLFDSPTPSLPFLAKEEQAECIQLSKDLDLGKDFIQELINDFSAEHPVGFWWYSLKEEEEEEPDYSDLIYELSAGK